MIEARIKATGRVTVEVRESTTGVVRRRFSQPNLVTTAGLDMIADWVTGGTALTCTHIAVGTDNTAPAAGDTTLGAEVYRGTIVQRTSSSGVATFKLLIGAGSANGSTLTEAGLLTASSGGTLFARSLFSSSISKTSSDTVTITWTVTFADA